MNETKRKILAVRTSKIIYREGDTVLKVFDSDYSKADVLNEALNQARVEETGLNIPRLIDVLVEDGKWAIRTEYVEGTTLARLMDENPEKTDEYLEYFTDLQTEVHEKRAEKRKKKAESKENNEEKK